MKTFIFSLFQAVLTMICFTMLIYAIKYNITYMLIANFISCTAMLFSIFMTQNLTKK